MAEKEGQEVDPCEVVPAKDDDDDGIGDNSDEFWERE